MDKYGNKAGTFFLQCSLQKARQSLVNECDKGRQTCGKIHSFLKEERGRSLKKPAVYMCGTPSQKKE